MLLLPLEMLRLKLFHPYSNFKSSAGITILFVVDSGDVFFTCRHLLDNHVGTLPMYLIQHLTLKLKVRIVHDLDKKACKIICQCPYACQN